MGVGLRRRSGPEAGVPGPDGGTSRILTRETERPRVGPMRDIVATIQPDQDAIVRADLADTVCVQGAPGTGKTAVGLHRAAYLLYPYRERLSRAGVLVVGPNRAFLGYIQQVLPALGEVDARQLTLEDLVTRVPPVRGPHPGRLRPGRTPQPAPSGRSHRPRRAPPLG
jgi:DNA helicase IV